MLRSRAFLVGGILVAVVCAVLAVVWWRGPGERPDANTLDGAGLLANLRGYLKVNRGEEAAQVLASLDRSGSGDNVDQARYEVARAYVAGGRGELAIPLLDRISLHDRSFDGVCAKIQQACQPSSGAPLAGGRPNVTQPAPV